MAATVQPGVPMGVKQEAREGGGGGVGGGGGGGGGQGEGDGRYSRESRDTMIQSMHYLHNIAAANYPLSLTAAMQRQTGQVGTSQHLATANYRPL